MNQNISLKRSIWKHRCISSRGSFAGATDPWCPTGYRRPGKRSKRICECAISLMMIERGMESIGLGGWDRASDKKLNQDWPGISKVVSTRGRAMHHYDSRHPGSSGLMVNESVS